MSSYKERVNRFRGELKKGGLEGSIVVMGDPHFNEYLQDYYKSIEWLSGFTGSAATLVVTQKGAALWSDSRYFTQGEEQLKGSSIEFIKSGVKGSPTIGEWLRESAVEGGEIAIDGSLVSLATFSFYKEEIAPLELVVVEDLFSAIWSDREERGVRSSYSKSVELSGESSKEKLERVREQFEGDFQYLITRCDDVAWLANIRGSEIPFNPLNFAYMVVSRERAILFIEESSVDNHLRGQLLEEGIECAPYSSIESYLKELDKEVPLIVEGSNISYQLFNEVVASGGVVIESGFFGGVVANLKAQKNRVEIEGFRRAMVLDGVAWVKFLRYIESVVIEGEESFNEFQLAEQLVAFRRECESYLGESFAPIVAYGANGALPHYSTNEESATAVVKKSFLLVDSGAHYPFGTTDTTRTVPMGALSEEERLDYTAVLRGMIALSSALFPEGTVGASLDILARGEVYKRGKRYLHGTGHGVGHHLPVHEGPQSIRVEYNPVTLKRGMVLSNEPAIYEEGRYGIRIENLIAVEEAKGFGEGEYNSFETLTFVPIAKEPIVVEKLGKEGVEWLNSYHQKVYTTLSPHLSEEERGWLKGNCAPL